MLMTPHRNQANPRHGLAAKWLLGGIVLLVVVVIAMGLWSGSVESPTKSESRVEYVVERGTFPISIPTSGELSASRLLEIRNPLETNGIIMEIADEGDFVHKDDVLIRFNQDVLEERIKDINDDLTDARNRMVSTEQGLAIAKSSMDSDLEKADLEIEIAELAIQAWREGELVKRNQELALTLETTTINSERLKKRFEQAATLVEKGFISRDEYERDRIAMIEARAKVKQAEIDQDVYTRFTRKQDQKKKESDVEQATAERQRVEQRHLAEIATKKAAVETATSRLTSTKERLTDIQQQFSLCTVRAPTDGLVVYRTSLSEGRWGDRDDPPTVGTSVSPNKILIILPDTSQMIANVKVSEALSGRVEPGQAATIFSDAHPNTPIPGTVDSISVLAKGGGWRDPNRRDYTVRILLHTDPAMELKPSMRCRAEIELGVVEDAISVPIQSVFRTGPLAFVYVADDGGWAQRKVDLGRASELAVEITAGLSSGERVLLREPDASEIVSRLSVDEEAPDASNKRATAS